MAEFDPSKGPQFPGSEKKAAKGSKVTADEAKGLGFAAGVLGGGIEQAAVLNYAVDRARTPVDDTPAKPSWWKRRRQAG